jgi:hypothetical protein
MLSTLFSKRIKTLPKLVGSRRRESLSIERAEAFALAASTRNDCEHSLTRELQNFEAVMDAVAADFAGEWCYIRLAGLAGQNEHGAPRVANLCKMRPMDELRMSHDPLNLYHDKAMSVSTSAGLQIGFLERHVAEDVFTRQSSGARFACFLCSIDASRVEELPRVKLALLSW